MRAIPDWPRDWIFVELGRKWYDRDLGWKLNESRNLFDMHNAPYAEPLVAADTKDEAAIAARKKLQTVLDQLNPAGGIVDQGGGAGKRGARKPMRQDQNANGSVPVNPGNQNEEGE